MKFTVATCNFYNVIKNIPYTHFIYHVEFFNKHLQNMLAGKCHHRLHVLKLIIIYVRCLFKNSLLN